jgi:hypothetical protein
VNPVTSAAAAVERLVVEVLARHRETDPMSRRDQFAMAALQGMLAGGTFNSLPYDVLIHEATIVADALIKELDK